MSTAARGRTVLLQPGAVGSAVGLRWVWTPESQTHRTVSPFIPRARGGCGWVAVGFGRTYACREPFVVSGQERGEGNRGEGGQTHPHPPAPTAGPWYNRTYKTTPKHQPTANPPHNPPQSRYRQPQPSPWRPLAGGRA